ncbi:MAG: DoxX family membrane protein [Patescibacteria group bacterium]
MKTKLIIFLSVIFLLPFFVSAHVKWFVDSSAVLPVEPYNLSDWRVWLAIISVMIVIAIAFMLERMPSLDKIFPSFFKRINSPIASLFSIFVGIGLVVFSLNGYIFAPNLIAGSSFDYAMLALQAIIGVAFILGLYARLASIFLFLLYLSATMYFGAWELIDALEIIGISLFILLFGRPKWGFKDIALFENIASRYQSLAIPLLRIFTGANLFILGFSEKLFRPDLGITFLHTHNWNFMQMLGFGNYSDYWFVFSAGIVESLLGLLLILGLLTRLTVFSLAIFFITTLILLGPTELFGHIPHFAIVMILLAFGSGERLKIGK